MREFCLPGNPNFMAGVPELVVLRLLRDREMYGYEIVQAIRLTHDGKVVNPRLTEA